jgi:hypothetical protein
MASTIFTTPVPPPSAYHHRQRLLDELTGQASECQFPEPVTPPVIGGEPCYRVYSCAECGSVLHVNGGKADQAEPIAVVFVICGFCAYPDFAWDLPFPEDLCRCFGWVYLNDED